MPGANRRPGDVRRRRGRLRLEGSSSDWTGTTSLRGVGEAPVTDRAAAARAGRSGGRALARQGARGLIAGRGDAGGHGADATESWRHGPLVVVTREAEPARRWLVRSNARLDAMARADDRNGATADPGRLPTRSSRCAAARLARLHERARRRRHRAAHAGVAAPGRSCPGAQRRRGRSGDRRASARGMASCRRFAAGSGAELLRRWPRHRRRLELARRLRAVATLRYRPARAAGALQSRGRAW